MDDSMFELVGILVGFLAYVVSITVVTYWVVKVAKFAWGV